MMKKKQLLWIGGSLIILVIALISLGAIFSKDDSEKLTGLSGHFDVSSKNMVAYVMYTEGRPELRLYDLNERRDRKVFELNNDKFILDPIFSQDGNSLAFISTNKNLDEDLSSTVYLLTLESEEVNDLFSRHSGISEVKFSVDESSLYYLNAKTFQNYSPIASKRLHDFDIYEYQIKEDKHIQKTNVEHYEMSSLHVGNDDSLYIQKMDDAHTETADDIFNTVQRIFQVSPEYPDPFQVISHPKREVDIYDFTLLPNGKEVIFQSISNIEAGGTFEYELYEYNLETKREKQLTFLGEYTTNPVYDAEMNKIYFMLDKRFAKGDPEYHLYRMNRDGSNIEEIPLEGK